MSGLFQDENTLPEPPPSGPGLFGDPAPVPSPSPHDERREGASPRGAIRPEADGESFAAWVARADEAALRGERVLEGLS